MSPAIFLSLFVSVAFAAAPSPEEYLRLNAVPAVMIQISKAESGFSQFTKDGSLLCDGVTGTHCGLFQLGAQHKKNAAKLGINTDTPRGNIQYALLLYQKEGTRPWLASEFDKTNPNAWGALFLADGTPRQNTDTQH